MTQKIGRFIPLNFFQILVDGIIGALSGLLMVTGLGSLGMALWSGAFGFFGSIGSELIAGKGFADMDWTGIFINTILGLGAGILGRAAINYMGKTGSSIIRHTQKSTTLWNRIDQKLFGYAFGPAMDFNIISKTKLVRDASIFTTYLSFVTRILNLQYVASK